MSISPSPGAELGASKDWYGCYNMVLKLQITLNLGLSAAKNTLYFKKNFKWNLFKIKFLTKKFTRS